MPAARYVELDWYDTPRYYDLVFDADTRREADFLETMHARHARRSKPGRRVLEPACGSGRLLVEMARRGWAASGIDLSQPMLDYAAQRLEGAGARAELRNADMADFRTRARFDLAHCLVSTFKYLLSEGRARAHLECVARALAPGGVYVLGMHLTDYADRARSRERWVAEADGTRVVCNIQGWPADRRRRREKVRARLVVDEDGRTLRSETLWDFRTYDAAQLRRLLRSVPALEHVATHDFNYDAQESRQLADDRLDKVLVLRRRA